MKMLKKSLKVEILLKNPVTFLSFVKLFVVEKSEKVKLYLQIK